MQCNVSCYISEAQVQNEVKQLKDKSVKTVLKVKGIKPDLHKQFVMSLSACLNWVR